MLLISSLFSPIYLFVVRTLSCINISLRYSKDSALLPHCSYKNLPNVFLKECVEKCLMDNPYSRLKSFSLSLMCSKE